MLMSALDKLTADERSLIDAIFFEEKSEREISHELGISQPAVFKRKNKILEKLKKILK